VWQICHKSLPTRGILCHRGVQVTSTYIFYVKKKPFLIVLCCILELLIFGLDVVFLMSRHCGIRGWKRHLSSIDMWNIWTYHSKFIFERTIPIIFSQFLVALRVFWSSSSHSRRLIREVVWKKGDRDTMVVNMDGSALTNLGKTSFCGLVHSFDGIFHILVFMAALVSLIFFMWKCRHFWSTSNCVGKLGLEKLCAF